MWPAVRYLYKAFNVFAVFNLTLVERITPTYSNGWKILIILYSALFIIYPYQWLPYKCLCFMPFNTHYKFKSSTTIYIMFRQIIKLINSIKPYVSVGTSIIKHALVFLFSPTAPDLLRSLPHRFCEFKKTLFTYYLFISYTMYIHWYIQLFYHWT